MATRADARSRLLAELAATPARKGYAITYDLLRNRAEAEEAVQEALVLRSGHDLPVAEVAELLGVELATVKTHLVRPYRNLLQGVTP